MFQLQDFSIKVSCTCVNRLPETFMNEIEPVFTEKHEFEFPNFSKKLAIFL